MEYMGQNQDRQEETQRSRAGVDVECGLMMQVVDEAIKSATAQMQLSDQNVSQKPYIHVLYFTMQLVRGCDRMFLW